VEGNAGADGAGSTDYSGERRYNVTVGNSYAIIYHYFQVYGTTDPSICEVYFTIASTNVSLVLLQFMRSLNLIHKEVGNEQLGIPYWFSNIEF